MGNLAWEMLLELLRYCASVKDITRTVQILLELLRYCASVKDFACTVVGDVATLLLSISPQQVRQDQIQICCRQVQVFSLLVTTLLELVQKHVHKGVPKKQKSEFWYFFNTKICILGIFGRANYGQVGCP